MNWKVIFSPLALAVAILCAKGGLGQPAAADDVDIWYKFCQDVPVPDATKAAEQQKDSKKVKVCLTQVDVRDNATAILIGKLAVRQVQGQEKSLLLAMLPLGSAIPSGALVKIDEKEPIKLAYMSCDKAGCYAEANIELADVDQMKSGKQIAYLGIDLTGREFSIPLPLMGFAKAFEGSPIPEDKYNEDRRKIAKLIKERCAELRKKKQDVSDCPVE